MTHRVIDSAAARADLRGLTISRIGGPLDCSGYTELVAAGDTFAVDVTSPDRQKLVTVTIDKRIMNAQSNNGAAFLESCFGAPFRFATKPGTPRRYSAARLTLCQ